MAGFWSGLSTTLRRLELVAADSRRLDDEAVDVLRALQYRLHWSSELLAGLDAPPGAQAGHAELEDALVAARDATGDIAEALELGGRAAAEKCLIEWRGALFRVRLARVRLSTSPNGHAPEPADERFSRGAAAATALTLAGVATFAAGAATGFWPIWAVGLALVAFGFLAYRP